MRVKARDVPTTTRDAFEVKCQIVGITAKQADTDAPDPILHRLEAVALSFPLPHHLTTKPH